MMFIGIFFFPLIGFFMLFFPEDIFEIVNSQQNEANGEPTRSFLIGTRIGGDHDPAGHCRTRSHDSGTVILFSGVPSGTRGISPQKSLEKSLENA